MSAIIGVPLQVLVLGTIISYGIAVLIQILLVAIRFFTKKQKNNN